MSMKTVLCAAAPPCSLFTHAAVGSFRRVHESAFAPRVKQSRYDVILPRTSLPVQLAKQLNSPVAIVIPGRISNGFPLPLFKRSSRGARASSELLSPFPQVSIRLCLYNIIIYNIIDTQLLKLNPRNESFI